MESLLILLEIWLRAVTECFVGYDPGKDQSKRQSNDDHDRSGEPGDCFGQRHDAKVVDCPVQIKPRNHDYDGWNGKRDPRITIVFFDQGRQKSCRERTAECGGCSWYTGKIHKLQTEGIGDGAYDGGGRSNRDGAVEHNGEAKHTKEAGNQS